MVTLVAAVFGTGIVGWVDPISFLVRSLGLSILPGVNYALSASLRALEHSSFSTVQTVGSVLHFIFGALVLSFKQPYFRQGVYLGLIFVFVVALNLRVSRFWCRALCRSGRCWASFRAGRSWGCRKDPSTAMTVISA